MLQAMLHHMIQIHLNCTQLQKMYLNTKGQNYKIDRILWKTKQISGFHCQVDKNWALPGYYAE
jgi:hypothetical protein